jgi:hypothetical protein
MDVKFPRCRKILVDTSTREKNFIELFDIIHSSLELPYDMEKLEKKEKSKKKATKHTLKGESERL